jgi:eukaryotic-like serine/threonine-protein kinase
MILFRSESRFGRQERKDFPPFRIFLFMNAERLKQIEEIYHAAREIALEGREAFLQKRCGGDAELRREVESLLGFEKISDSLFDSPIDAFAAEMFSERENRADLTGRKISHYRIERLLGAGGMGEVYLAEDTELKRRVALKVLLAEVAGDKDRLRRFVQEAHAASALNHPNILTIHEFGVENDLHFIATEFVRGINLREKLTRGGLTLGETLDVAAQVASALAEAHEAGIIHRDIKPENIMLRSDGFVKVLDFGLAKLIERETARPGGGGSEEPTKRLLHTRRGSVLGTAAYMSPEQARGLKVDARTDIWSLGVVLYEMLAGRSPFAGETRIDIIAAALSSEPPPISSYGQDIPAELDWIVSKTLSKDVEGRYQTAKELRADLEKIRKQIEFEIGVSRLAITDPGKGLTKEEKIHSTVPAAADTASFFQQIQTNQLRYSVFALILLTATSLAVYFVFVSLKDNRRIDSIAVLPLENSSRNPELNFVSDGLSEALIDRLSQLPQLKVIARNSSFAFRGADTDLREVARKLGVRTLVTGSVAQSGDELAIRVDVMDAVENTHLTGAHFRRKIGDLLDIQSKIARMTAEKLQLKLTSSQSKRLAEHETENSEAYRFYLSGLVELNGSLGAQSRALEYFEQAAGLDPNFAAAHTEIAWIYWARANASDDPRELMPKAKAATERALEINPEYAKAHVLKAMVSEYEFDWQGAESEYRRAIELSPSLNFARNNYAFFLSIMNRQEEALAELEQQSARDPINRRLALLQKAIVLTQARRFDDALETYREAQTVEPAKEIPQFAVGYAYAGKGLYYEAADCYRKSIVLLGGEEKYSQPLVYLAAIYAKMPEKRSEARAILRRIEAMDEYTSPALLAAVYTALDDNDKAMELLEQAHVSRDLLLRFIGVGYEYDGLRHDPRFTGLTRRIGLEY